MSTRPSAFARIINRITTRTPADNERAVAVFNATRTTIPGWSLPLHYAFFEAVAQEMPKEFSALICGVYHGLDLALLTKAAGVAGRNLTLTGVDLFSDQPCADWTPEQKARLTWEGNGFGPPPNREAAQRNAPKAGLVQDSASRYLASAATHSFDFVYLDTSHDLQTVGAEIDAARRTIKPGGIMAGDDYSHNEEAGYGVQRAVCAALPYHAAVFSRVWLSPIP